MIIRQERPSDYDEVEQLVKMSFATNPDHDGATHEYLKALRGQSTFIPELSLVAESPDGKIVGQVVLYKTPITTPLGEQIELLLSPICVHPKFVRGGTARSLVEAAAVIAKGMGFRAVFLCGDPDIYVKLGFTPSFRYNIYHKADESKAASWSMVRELYCGALDGVIGTVDTV